VAVKGELEQSRDSIHTRTDNEVGELIAVKVLHTSLLNTTVVAFKVPPLGSYAPMPALSPPFKKNFGTDFVEWFSRATVVILLMSSVSSKCLYLREQKKVIAG